MLLNMKCFHIQKQYDLLITDKEQIFWLVYVCVCFVLCKFVSGVILLFWENLRYDDLCA